jgi:hypothetical protein
MPRCGRASRASGARTTAPAPPKPPSSARREDCEAWHLAAADEGHGFRKQDNSDYAFLAQLVFWEKHLLGE